MEPGPLGPDTLSVKRPPVQLISIDLVRRLVDGMEGGVNVTPCEFLKLMPIGWYQAEFEALVEGSDDIETIPKLVMVFDGQKEGYELFFEYLLKVDLNPLSSECATIADAEPLIEESLNRFFPQQSDELSRPHRKDLFHVARHVAQNEGLAPRFCSFEEREAYDVDGIAKDYLARKLDRTQEHEALKTEFHRRDRFWLALYPRYDLFKTQYDACVNRILSGPAPVVSPPVTLSPPDEREPSEEIKAQVKFRDGYRCLCCGETKRRRLQIDHISPWYLRVFFLGEPSDPLQRL